MKVKLNKDIPYSPDHIKRVDGKKGETIDVPEWLGTALVKGGDATVVSGGKPSEKPDKPQKPGPDETKPKAPDETKTDGNDDEGGFTGDDEPDDLTLLPGIGPKLAEKLVEAGYDTFAIIGSADEKVEQFLVDLRGVTEDDVEGIVNAALSEDFKKQV